MKAYVHSWTANLVWPGSLLKADSSYFTLYASVTCDKQRVNLNGGMES